VGTPSSPPGASRAIQYAFLEIAPALDQSLEPRRRPCPGISRCVSELHMLLIRWITCLLRPSALRCGFALAASEAQPRHVRNSRFPLISPSHVVLQTQKRPVR